MATKFRELCEEMTRTLTPALSSAGYVGPEEPFSRHVLRYEFKRAGTRGIETIAVLFNRKRSPQFSIQLYIEPPAGLDSLQANGGELIVGVLSPRRSMWPLGVYSFGQTSWLSRLLRQPPPSAAEAVQSAIAFLPEIDAWWRDQRSRTFIVASKLTYPGSSTRQES